MVSCFSCISFSSNFIAISDSALRDICNFNSLSSSAFFFFSSPNSVVSVSIVALFARSGDFFGLASAFDVGTSSIENM